MSLRLPTSRCSRSRPLTRAAAATCTVLAVCATMLGVVPNALAQQPQPQPQQQPAGDQAEARRLFEEGLGFVDSEDWTQALDRFTRSRAIVERPSTVLNIATALSRLGRARESVREFEHYLTIATSPADRAGREQVRALMETTRASIARLTLTVSPGTAAVAVDGELSQVGGDVREILVDPGHRVFVVRAAEHTDQTFELDLPPGARISHTITLARVAAAPTTGTLSVTSNVSTAVISIDGEEAGRGSVSREVPPGRRRIDVRAEDYLPFTEQVDVLAGRTATVRADLVEEGGSVFSSPVFWVITGAVVVGAGVTVGVVVATQ